MSTSKRCGLARKVSSAALLEVKPIGS